MGKKPKSFSKYFPLFYNRHQTVEEKLVNCQISWVGNLEYKVWPVNFLGGLWTSNVWLVNCQIWLLPWVPLLWNNRLAWFRSKNMFSWQTLLKDKALRQYTLNFIFFKSRYTHNLHFTKFVFGPENGNLQARRLAV